jgi:hypothetical protein
MSRQTSDHLKGRFEKGDLPSQDDFSDLIDSCFNAISGYNGSVTFVDNNSITNTVTISAGLIAKWVQI